MMALLLAALLLLPGGGTKKLDSSLYLGGEFEVKTTARAVSTADGTDVLSMVARNAGRRAVIVGLGGKLYHLEPGQSMRLWAVESAGFRERQERLTVYTARVGPCGRTVWAAAGSGVASLFRGR
jgi:hypothetical protein